MRKAASFVIIVGLALSFATVGVALGHSGTGVAGIVVEPASVTAGDTVVLAGTGLEPDSDRVLVLASSNLTIEFGTVKTDATGMFSKQLTIPGHLPTGDYELRAIGDETLTTALRVTAGAGAAPPPNDPLGAIVNRSRPAIEIGLIIAFIAVAAIAGGLLIWRAERFRGASGD